MTHWPSTKARRVLAVLLSIGWSDKRQSGSHRTLTREGWPDFVFAFHDGEEIGPRMLVRISKHTGLVANDLYSWAPENRNTQNLLRSVKRAAANWTADSDSSRQGVLIQAGAAIQRRPERYHGFVKLIPALY